MNEQPVEFLIGVDATDGAGSSPKQLHVVAEARASANVMGTSPLSIVLAIDTSGSMDGQPLDSVISSVTRLLELVGPNDKMGIVTFSSTAQVVAPLMRINHESMLALGSVVQSIRANGRTNIDDGLQAAASLLRDKDDPNHRTILLLSDGQPNRGRQTQEELADIVRSLRPDIAVSTLGYGESHNEDILAALSDAGAGRYHFISDPAVCNLEFVEALGIHRDIIAQDIEVSLRPLNGAQLVGFLGATKIELDPSLSVKIALNDLIVGSYQLFAAEVRPHDSAADSSDILEATLSYRIASTGERQCVSAIVRRIGDVEPARRAMVNARLSLLQIRARETRLKARKLADEGQFAEGAELLRMLTKNIEGASIQTPKDEAVIVETLAQIKDEVQLLDSAPSPAVYRKHKRAQLGELISSSRMSDEPPPSSRLLLDAVAGELPNAHLVVTRGDNGTAIFVLNRPRMLIGRTPSAHIHIKDETVSRRHGLIRAQDGKFVLENLAGTNPINVNGKPLIRPIHLKHGDTLQIGQTLLRYESPETAPIEPENGPLSRRGR
ncbi:VWA domain-containing protein [Sorangium sp. So ce1151]|uniref:VWA domain-containing protein n=1 Tax=Sorangium sp. So ce1151 TaxID=3133332 RepID=UPI003F5D902D